LISEPAAARAVTSAVRYLVAGTCRREVAVDKLTFNADGTIQKVTPSSRLSL